MTINETTGGAAGQPARMWRGQAMAVSCLPACLPAEPVARARVIMSADDAELFTRFGMGWRGPRAWATGVLLAAERGV